MTNKEKLEVLVLLEGKVNGVAFDLQDKERVARKVLEGARMDLIAIAVNLDDLSLLGLGVEYQTEVFRTHERIVRNRYKNIRNLKEENLTSVEYLRMAIEDYKNNLK